MKCQGRRPSKRQRRYIAVEGHRRAVGREEAVHQVTLKVSRICDGYEIAGRRYRVSRQVWHRNEYIGSIVQTSHIGMLGAP